MSTYVAANADPADAPEIERAMREFFGRWENTVDPLAEQGMILHEGAGFALCHHGPAGLDVTFVPVTPSRQKLGEIGQETLRSFS